MANRLAARVGKLEQQRRERKQQGEAEMVPWNLLDVASVPVPSQELAPNAILFLEEAARRYVEATETSGPWVEYRRECKRLGVAPREADFWDTDFCPIEETMRMLAGPTLPPD